MADPEDPDLEAAYALETPEDSRRLYRAWAGTYDTEFAAKSGYRFARLVAEAYLAEGGGWPALDAGCGTGLVADELPGEAVVDGLDISAEMLAEAGRKGRCRRLIEADLTRPLPLSDAVYAGLLSAGTFTHGHVGPEALRELLRVLRPGALCVVAANAVYYDARGFADLLDALVAEGRITRPTLREERIYEGAEPPEGHETDTGWIIVFRRLET